MELGPDPRRSKSGLLRVSRRMFILGFFLLPWMWLMNWIYMREHLKLKDCPPMARWYARASLLLFFIVTPILLTWMAAFQLYRHDMGQHGIIGEWISLYEPYGDW